MYSKKKTYNFFQNDVGLLVVCQNLTTEHFSDAMQAFHNSHIEEDFHKTVRQMYMSMYGPTYYVGEDRCIRRRGTSTELEKDKMDTCYKKNIPKWGRIKRCLVKVNSRLIAV